MFGLLYFLHKPIYKVSIRPTPYLVQCEPMTSCQQYLKKKGHTKGDGLLNDIKSVFNDYISDFKSKYTTDWFITNDGAFVEEATRLLKLSGSWTPYTYHGDYVDMERIFFINFVYHQEYFKRDKNEFVLNPDVKPEYIGEREIYETIINPHHGCDGFVTFIAIVELDGKLSNEYWIDCQGKTNPTIGLTYLSKLSKWKPAIKDSKDVRSQIIITVKTQ